LILGNGAAIFLQGIVYHMLGRLLSISTARFRGGNRPTTSTQRRSQLSPQLFAYIFAFESLPVPRVPILEVARLEKSGKSVPIETKFPPIINATELSPHYSMTEIDPFWTQHVAYSPSDDQLCNSMTVPRPQ
jgi:hypothetical protein